MTEFPTELKVSVLELRHPEWTASAEDWNKMELLYKGGRAIKAAADQFLYPRPKELSEVFAARLARFSYVNHIGTAVDWYLAAEFEKPPRVDLADGSGVSGDFYAGFMRNCDCDGTLFTDKFREVLQHLLVFGRAFVLVDMPEQLGVFTSRADELASGQLSPYLVVHSPLSVINWAKDKHDRLEWVIVRCENLRSLPFQEPVSVTNWYYYDRSSFAVYEHVPKKNESTANAVAKLVAQGENPLSSMNTVPIDYVELPEGAWLVNRAYLPAVDHLNTENVLGWALLMAALAMPVIKTDAEVSVSLSEAGFIKLPRDSDYSWSEPDGKSFGALALRARSLVEDVFRAFYLIAQARSTDATPAAQSGVSKQQDMAPSQKMLNFFGDVIRGSMQRVIGMVSQMRGDSSAVWNVSGFTFPDGPIDGALATIAAALALQVPSLTAERELFKLAVSMLFSDADKLLVDKIYKEIDAAPSRAEAAQAFMRASASLLPASMANLSKRDK